MNGIGHPTWMGWYYIVGRGVTPGTFALQKVHVLSWSDRPVVYAFEPGDDDDAAALEVGIPRLVSFASLMHESAVGR